MWRTTANMFAVASLFLFSKISELRHRARSAGCCLAANNSENSGGAPFSLEGRRHIRQRNYPERPPGDRSEKYTPFLNSIGVAFNQTNSIFGQALMYSPVPGGTGNGEGTLGFTGPFHAGPVGNLGAFSDPFSIVTSALGSTQVSGFVQALEFAPQTPISPVPEPTSLVIFSSALFGLCSPIMLPGRRRPGSAKLTMPLGLIRSARLRGRSSIIWSRRHRRI